MMKETEVIFGEEVKKLFPTLDKIKKSGFEGKGFFSFKTSTRITNPIDDNELKFNEIQAEFFEKGVKKLIYSLNL